MLCSRLPSGVGSAAFLGFPGWLGLWHGAMAMRTCFPNKLRQITYLNSVVMPDDEDEDEVDDNTDEEEGSVEVDD